MVSPRTTVYRAFPASPHRNVIVLNANVLRALMTCVSLPVWSASYTSEW